MSDHEVQIADDKKTLWVHAPDGSTVGRFSARFGVDIHRTVAEQISGLPQCLRCTHGRPSTTEWLEFVDYANTHWGLAIEVSSISLIED